ncbi:hypothetical protein COCC4DRAFT_200590 [Bipolaris maydis ATCC 48331]|nr:uncharacterized protein COCC4DRAFT_200590 [Bipolaris maydis ATCC 48331]ENI03092.1 hypothetical protein COCC4DRAFT_200590 [Bipolaris maydis ATCC 48331]KAJ6267389.1 hypothetical protein PSV08DRAFT_208238 [Bipolaris maydis]KAJ6267659.1 hypothetical protein PSV08DRAFT_229285 [Bipolaris maydis]
MEPHEPNVSTSASASTNMADDPDVETPQQQDGRHHQTRDARGRPLNLVPSRLDVGYKWIEYIPEFDEISQDAEDTIYWTEKGLWKESLREWKKKGKHGDPPQQRALSAANPMAYHNARILNSFPSIFNAIEQWQASHPDEPRIIAKMACRGSAKMDYILKTIKEIASQETTIPHPDPQRAAKGETFAYQRKYVVTSSLQVCRALLWCRIVQEMGEACVAHIMNRSERNDTMDGWRDIYDPVSYERKDKVWIMVAGLSVICPPTTLTEGNILHGLEPPSLENMARQAAKCQYHGGQTQDVVKVRWLVHKQSIIETNMVNERST